MAEYIDRDKLIRHLEDDFEACGEPDSSIRPIAYGTILGLRGALSYARTLPKADVVEVVRCKNCKYFEAITLDSGISVGFGNCKTQKGINLYPKETDFCSYGERSDT